MNGLDECSESLLFQARKKLEKVFGFSLQPLDELDEKYKGQFILINTLMVNHGFIRDGYFIGSSAAGDEDMARERAKTSLLFLILSLIFMSSSQVVGEEVLDAFLQKLGVLPIGDAGGDDTQTAALDDGILNLFGDVKALIRDEFGKKQHYINMTEVTER